MESIKQKKLIFGGITVLGAAALVSIAVIWGRENPADGNEGESVQGETDQEQYDFAENDGEERLEDKDLCMQNPIASVEEDTWDDYGTGDPYVMRYNGNYYLYMSTRDTEIGVKCFSSRDLVNWNYEGLCTQEELTKAAYAPEVVYYNGKFYMYTSPAGHGHYVLASESPTGPFEVISDNLGLSIDGSVFIDDDGAWYFYHAGDFGIQGHEMNSPSEMNEAGIDVHAYMDGWTEGPMVVKHDGRYFMTYTGNHVFSDGYRINYGVGDGPKDFEEGSNNPVLVSSMGDVRGVGHSSSVKGPDLDSYYMVYHSLVGVSTDGMPNRAMYIDRIVFNEDRMEVLGPTTSGQQAPDMPAVYAYFDESAELEAWESEKAEAGEHSLTLQDGGYILSKKALRDQFTAEYNLHSTDSEGRFGGYFCYTDQNNYGCFVLDAQSQTVRVELVEAKEKKELEFELPSSFGEPAVLSENQTFQVEKRDEDFYLFFHDRLLGQFQSGLTGGRIGYFAEGCTAECGFIGGSNVSGGLSACTYAKPIPGRIQGIHYASCSDSMEKISSESLDFENSMSLLANGEENSAEYLVNVESDGVYDFSILYAAENTVQCSIFEGEEELSGQGITLTATGGSGQYRMAVSRGIYLKQGVHMLRLEIKGAQAAISEFAFHHSEETEQILIDYESIVDNNIYSDGRWKTKDGRFVMDNLAHSAGKRMYGNENWGDYSVEADIEFASEDMDAGLLIRTSNPAPGGAGSDPDLGTWFFQGYYAAIRGKQLTLGKVNYKWKELESVPMEFVPGQVYHLCVSAEGNVIRVEVDGAEQIVYEDDMPFTNGAAGVRCYQSMVGIDNFEVKPK